MVAYLVMHIYRVVVGRAVKLITRRTDQKCERVAAHTNSRSAGYYRTLRKSKDTGLKKLAVDDNALSVVLSLRLREKGGAPSRCPK